MSAACGACLGCAHSGRPREDAGAGYRDAVRLPPTGIPGGDAGEVGRTVEVSATVLPSSREAAAGAASLAAS